jgi:hypothetical protein
MKRDSFDSPVRDTCLHHSTTPQARDKPCDLFRLTSGLVVGPARIFISPSEVIRIPPLPNGR